jgi:hypothetical protein
MNMIGHEHAGVDGAFVAGRGLGQPIEIGAIIAVKDRFPAMATLDDMGLGIGQEKSGFRGIHRLLDSGGKRGIGCSGAPFTTACRWGDYLVAWVKKAKNKT